MLQLQPGERKVIKAAGEVDISTQYLRNIYTIPTQYLHNIYAISTRYLRRTCLGSCRACTPGPAAAWAGHTGTPTPARWSPSPHCRGTGAHITISHAHDHTYVHTPPGFTRRLGQASWTSCSDPSARGTRASTSAGV